jgi:tRNA-dihydrouridine synthase
MMDETGCDFVMIGRAVRGNPWIFSQMNHYFETGELLERPSWEEVKAMMLRHAQMEIELRGEYTGIREMRKHVAWYTTGMPHSAKLRKSLSEMEDYETLERFLKF